MSTIVFRTDASTVIGAGHVMRSIALAMQLREMGNAVRFVCREHPGHLIGLITNLGFEVSGLAWQDVGADRGLGAHIEQDVRETVDALKGTKPDWLVVDHYAIDARWEKAIAPKVGRIAVIDDLADRPHHAALLIDQNLQGAAGRYVGRVVADCMCLLGPRYALLRPEFAAAGDAVRQRDGRLQNLLACAGGADPKNLLGTVLAAWKLMGNERRPSLDLVVGAASPNLPELRQRCADIPGCTLHVQTDRMAELMAQADLMVCPGGTLNWERCCMALPAVMIQTADNQASNVVELMRARTGISIGAVEDVSPTELAGVLRCLSQRSSLSRQWGARSRRLVDGHGALRVAVAMLAGDLNLRPAQADDAKSAWTWRNAETTRQYSTDARAIPLADHLRWWAATLTSTQHRLLIAQIGTRPVGVIRLDFAESYATVSIYLDPLLTGLRLGPRLLDLAASQTRIERPALRKLRAVIDARNRASIRAFEGACYIRADDAWYRQL